MCRAQSLESWYNYIYQEEAVMDKIYPAVKVEIMKKK